MVKLQETESFIYGVGERLVIESTVELSFERFWSVLIFIFSILSLFPSERCDKGSMICEYGQEKKQMAIVTHLENLTQNHQMK